MSSGDLPVRRIADARRVRDGHMPVELPPQSVMPPLFRPASSQSIDRRRQPLDNAQVVVQQIDIASGDLYRSAAMTEDSLEAENITAVGQKRACERVAQHVGTAARLDAGTVGEATNELINAARSQARAARTRNRPITPAS